MLAGGNIDSTEISLLACVFSFLAVLARVRVQRHKHFRPQPPRDHADGDCFPFPVMRGDFKSSSHNGGVSNR